MRQNGAYKPDFGRKVGESPYYTTEFDPIRLIFADTAPAAYHGKEIPLPRGWYGLGISAQERMVLYDDKSTIAIADASMKIIAKQHLKGRIEDIDGDYVLTLELTGISGIIRVYRIVEK